MYKSMSKKSAHQHNADSLMISSIFQLEIHSDIFFSRCQDTGEKPDMQKAKMFKESLNKVNSKKHPLVLNLNSMRIGVNTIMKLITILENHNFTELNLSDNSISEYGMHAIKNLISSTKIEHLNLASNMISEVGLSLILEDFIKNSHIKSLNLGIEEGSIRKNSLGIDGARCLAAILLQNKTLQVLKLQDNDIGINGAEIISIPLKKNKVLKQLKISENLIKTEGAEYILLNAMNLTSLDIGKNFIKSSIGPALKKYVETNKSLRSLNIEYNQLTPQGAQTFFQGVMNSQLEEINIRGNSIGDRGLALIEQLLIFNDRQIPSLHLLNISTNDITKEGVRFIIPILNCCRLKTLNISKNLLGDEGIIQLINYLKSSPAGDILQKLDLSGCKISDRGFIHLAENASFLSELRYLKVADNYISQKYEKIYAEILIKNHTLIMLNLQGNRLSLSGLKAIKKIIDKNFKDFQEKEPKKMRSEILNLKEKQKKIKEAQDKIEKQKREISKLEETKARLNDNIARLEKEEKDRKIEHEDSVRRKTEQLGGMVEDSENKLEALNLMKEEREKNIEELNTQLLRLREKRKQLEYELAVAENQGEAIQKQFEKKVKKEK